MATPRSILGAAFAIATLVSSGPLCAGDQVEQVVAADNTFGLALLAGLAPGNTIVSPHGIASATAMALAGARGETEREMAQVLGTPLAAGENAAARRRLGRLLASQEPQFVVANALHLTRHGDLVAPSYKETVGTFGAELFAGSDLAAINGWVSARSNGRIARILTRLDPNSACVLVNATFFKGAWQTAFPKRRTAPAAFRLLDGTTAEVPTMRTAGAFPVVRAHAFDALALPYRGGTIAMVILLPMRTPGEGFLHGPSPAAAKALLADLRRAAPERMELWLPRFTLESEADLVPLLKGLGMRLAFDRDRADFSGITESTDEDKRLHISQVRTRAFISADEDGTEAAAATAVEIAKRAGRPAPIVRVDRPFVFMIADLESGAILFAGRVTDPRGKPGTVGGAEDPASRARLAGQVDPRARVKELFERERSPATPRIGGPCRYATYPGQCTITDVQRTSDSIRQKIIEGGPRYEGYRIAFRFAGAAPEDNRLVAQALAREHELRLANSWYPGARFVEKYGIRAARSFACTLKTIEAGPCPPILFDIPAVDRTDYFESAR